MIQKYTCVPIDEYDVVIVTNGTVNQVDQALASLSLKPMDDITADGNTIFLDTFKDLILHLSLNEKLALTSNIQDFKGKTVFMFFNGLEYIQNFICEVIDYHGSLLASSITESGKLRYNLLHNSYFYFDSSVTHTKKFDIDESVASEAYQFNYICTIVNDILKKLSFMLYRIRGVCVDDAWYGGERVYSLRGLLRNFSNLERVDLTSNLLVVMRDLVV